MGPIVLRSGLPIVFLLLTTTFGRVLRGATSSHLAPLRNLPLALPRCSDVVVTGLGGDRSPWQFARMNSVHRAVSLTLKQVGEFGCGQGPNHLRCLRFGVLQGAN